MKRFAVIFLCISLLFSLCACGKPEEIRFYYARKEVLYGVDDGVIAPEIRDATGYENDLAYLLMLYLEGPHSQELASPFPRGTTLSQLEIQDQQITLVLSEAFSQLQGLDYTIACTCIAYTCFSIYACESVTIRSTPAGSPSITLTANSIALVDGGDIK